jgi:hypothetical protein
MKGPFLAGLNFRTVAGIFLALDLLLIACAVARYGWL